MLAIRLFLVLIGVVLVLSLLGYAINRDRRWSELAALAVKVGFALILLMLLLLLVERLLLVV